MAVLFIVGCQKGELQPVEYMKWIENENNGLRVKKEIGNFEFMLQYKPLEYVTLLEQKMANTQSDSIRRRTLELGDMQYYTFRITSKKDDEMLKTGVQSEEDYYGRLDYFISAIQDDIALVDGKDTLPCLLYHFERNYALAPYSNMVLGFKNIVKKNIINNKTFIYDDAVLGTGPVQITIKGNDLLQIPKLKTYIK